MNNVVLKLELEVSAQKMIQQVMIGNNQLEDQIKKGIELAIKDLTDGDNFVEIIRQETRQQVFEVVKRAVTSYNVQHVLSAAVETAVKDKINKYANALAEKMVENIKPEGDV